MRPVSLCLLLALVGCAHLRAQQASPHAQALVETIQRLRNVGLPRPDELDNTPAPVPGLPRGLNQELKALIKAQDLYVGIAKTGGVFQVSQVREAHPAGCQGKTAVAPFMEHNLPTW